MSSTLRVLLQEGSGIPFRPSDTQDLREYDALAEVDVLESYLAGLLSRSLSSGVEDETLRLVTDQFVAVRKALEKLPKGRVRQALERHSVRLSEGYEDWMEHGR